MNSILRSCRRERRTAAEDEVEDEALLQPLLVDECEIWWLKPLPLLLVVPMLVVVDFVLLFPTRFTVPVPDFIDSEF